MTQALNYFSIMNENVFNRSLLDIAEGVKSCQCISLCYISEPSMNKAQKAAVRVLSGADDSAVIEKRTCGQFQFNYSYENAVNNRGAKEQGAPIDFVAAPLSWGSWLEGFVNKVIEHKGDLYLRFYGLKNGKVENEYFVGGKAATEEQVALIKQFTERGEVKSQASAGLTENQVIARNVKFSNIVSVKMNGISLTRKSK